MRYSIGESRLHRRLSLFFPKTMDARFIFIIVSLGAGALLVKGVCLWWRDGEPVATRPLRGRRLRAARAVHESLPVDPHGFRWGACVLPHRLAYGHLAVVGATGSGKTLLQRLLMQSVLPRIGHGLDQRALIYDPKQDLCSMLAGMKLSAPLHLLNPLDARGVAWDMAADVTSPAAALQAATLLIPKAAHDANPFFSNAARHLLHGVLVALILLAPKRWTLRHVLLITRTETLLRQILARMEATRHLLQYCEHAATFQNILSTVLTRLAPYEIIAAAWDRTERRVSLRRWLATESILILGNDEDNRAALDTINQLIFKRLSELILAQPEREPASERTTWLLLDEIREAGRLDGLSALLTKGRSKGAAVLLGF